MKICWIGRIHLRKKQCKFHSKSYVSQTVIEGLSFLSSTLQILKFKGSGIPDWESSAIPDPWFHPGQFFCTSASFATSEMFHRNRIFAVTRIHIRYRIKNRRILIIRLQFGKSQLLGIGRGNEHDIIQTCWPDLEQNPWSIILINICLFWDFIRFQLHGYVNHRCCKYRNVRLWYMCYYSISACRWARIDKVGDLYMMIICRKLSKKITISIMCVLHLTSGWKIFASQIHICIFS